MQLPPIPCISCEYDYINLSANGLIFSCIYIPHLSKAMKSPHTLCMLTSKHTPIMFPDLINHLNILYCIFITPYSDSICIQFVWQYKVNNTQLYIGF